MKPDDDLHHSKKVKLSVAPSVTYSAYSHLARISEYGVFAANTAIYERVSVPRNLSYLYCGVVEEFCEFKSAASALSNNSDTEMQEGLRNGVFKELGDITWYLTAMCNELEVKLDDMIETDSKPEENVQVKSDKEETVQAKMVEVLDEILLNIGTIGGKIKKAIRDDDDVITTEKKDIIVSKIRQIFALLSNKICPVYATTLLHVMYLNKNKVESRFARGVVHGDGDNR